MTLHFISLQKLIGGSRVSLLWLPFAIVYQFGLNFLNQFSILNENQGKVIIKSSKKFICNENRTQTLCSTLLFYLENLLSSPFLDLKGALLESFLSTALSSVRKCTFKGALKGFDFCLKSIRLSKTVKGQGFTFLDTTNVSICFSLSRL